MLMCRDESREAIQFPKIYFMSAGYAGGYLGYETGPEQWIFN